MSTLLIKNARGLLVTMDAQRREIVGGAVFVAGDHVIEAVGASAELPPSADEVIDGARPGRHPRPWSQHPSPHVPDADPRLRARTTSCSAGSPGCTRSGPT